MYIFLQIIVLTVLLLLFQESLRRKKQWTVWSLFLLMPLLLTPYWIQVNEFDLFLWFKYYTIFFCVCWGTALRFTSLGSRAWARSTIPLLLAANILEAVVVDLAGHGSAHALNAAAGLLLIAAMPYGKNSMRIDSASCYRDLLHGIGRPWVIGYTLWNWTFVYLNYPSITGHHTAVLVSALIVGMNDPRRWLQTRAATLGINLLFTATSFSGMVAWLDTSTWFNEQIGIVAAGIAFVFMIGCAIQFWLPRIAPATAANRPGTRSFSGTCRRRWRDRRIAAQRSSKSQIAIQKMPTRYQIRALSHSAASAGSTSGWTRPASRWTTSSTD